MATARQIAANRENAKKSTGPVSPEGKAKSRLNHLSHGLTCSNLSPGFTRSNVLLLLEDPAELNALLSDLIDHFQPADIVEQILVEKMAQNQWLSLRAVAVQVVSLCASVANGYTHKDLGVLVRYQTASDRAFHKAHAELLKVQKERKKSEIGFQSQKSSEAAKAVEVAGQPPVESPQNPPRPPEKPPVQVFTASSGATFATDTTPKAPETVARIEELPQAA